MKIKNMKYNWLVNHSMGNSPRISKLKIQVTFLNFACNFSHVFPLPRSSKSLCITVLFSAILHLPLYPSELPLVLVWWLRLGGWVRNIGPLRCKWYSAVPFPNSVTLSKSKSLKVSKPLFVFKNEYISFCPQSYLGMRQYTYMIVL